MPNFECFEANNDRKEARFRSADLHLDALVSAASSRTCVFSVSPSFSFCVCVCARDVKLLENPNCLSRCRSCQRQWPGSGYTGHIETTRLTCPRDFVEKAQGHWLTFPRSSMTTIMASWRHVPWNRGVLLSRAHCVCSNLKIRVPSPSRWPTRAKPRRGE